MSIKLYLRIISIIVATIAPLAVAQQLANLPTEQISLHLDKQHFEGGDTITVQGVVTSHKALQQIRFCGTNQQRFGICKAKTALRLYWQVCNASAHRPAI